MGREEREGGVGPLQAGRGRRKWERGEGRGERGKGKTRATSSSNVASLIPHGNAKLEFCQSHCPFFNEK